MRPARLGRGYVQVYTGEGKGKTTAALGLALRAAGHGLKVEIFQFMKGKIDYGELEGARMLSPNVTIHQLGREVFVDRKEPDEEDRRMARHGWELAKESIRKKSADIIVLDEINCAVDYGLIPLAELLEIVRSKPYDLELILTGRSAPPEIVEAADLVTEMLQIKHYYYEGVEAREGIEH
jgi:cob(I)alamin adenosyltransferase